MLHRYEKIAAFNLTIVLLAVILFFLSWLILGFERPHGVFWLLGLTGLVHLIFMRKKNPSEIIEDERDREIRLKASSGGYSASLVFFIVGSLAVYYFNHQAGVVSVYYFPAFVWIGWAVFVLVSSVITIVQYRRGASGECCQS